MSVTPPLEVYAAFSTLEAEAAQQNTRQPETAVLGAEPQLVCEDSRAETSGARWAINRSYAFVIAYVLMMVSC